ncbi:hypothetical protein TR13x_01080 [Caloranaerobacter sp. TR13]|uniref:AAA family ATPase n=1 Tax=Caloranaerobacter sp. TR13 TaxID=1302151 RepID=UPI0006D4559D|nr:AAA family ATPase [Caloranaerobacter sp. TR13]KPU27973.1 hypothetical protein TR13x_01080 [Caloranaerobacter sp. TR13]
MLLEYLWIEDFKILKNIGISFSKYFNIQCEKRDEVFYVKIEKKLNLIPNDFFGNKISNINAIVGSNGSGKSSLLSYIQGELPYSCNHLHIYFDEKNKVIKYISTLRVEIKNNTEFLVTKLYDKNHANQIPSITKSRLAIESKQMIKYIKCNLEYSPLMGKTNLSDKNGKFFPYIDFDEELELFKTESFQVLNSYIIIEILSLLNSINADSALNIKLPNKIILHIFTERDNSILKIRDIVKLEGNKGLDPYLNKAYKYHNSILQHTEKKDLNYLVNFMLCYYLLYLNNLCFLEGIDLYSDKYYQYINNVDYYNSFESTLETFINKILPIRDEQIKLKKPTLRISSAQIKVTSEKILDILNGISKIDGSKIRYYAKPTRFEIELDYIENKSELFPLLFRMFRNDEYFNQEIYSIDWYGMSEGEMNILKTIAKLNSYVKRKARYLDRVETLLVLIDEADSSLHPDLARRFIDILIQVTELLLRDYNIKVQYIITTHSPFLISDLPKDNCVFLKKDAKRGVSLHSFKENTFAGNIYTLLSNAFFMKDFSGQFAHKNIQKTIRFITENKYSENKEYVDYVLNIIGEPILKKIILNSIDRKENIHGKN